MTDAELIARLRGRSQFCKDRGEVKSPDLMNEAADRIEQLVATNEALTKERDTAREYAGEVRIREKVAEDARIEAEAKLSICERHRDTYAEMGRIGTQAVRDLEAKLAKAVEALEYYNVAGHEGKEARATLAEIKGESHE